MRANLHCPISHVGEGKPVADAGHIGSRLAHYASNQGIRRQKVRLIYRRKRCKREGGEIPLPKFSQVKAHVRFVDRKI